MARLTCLHDLSKLCHEGTYVLSGLYQVHDLLSSSSVHISNSFADSSGDTSGDDPAAKTGTLDLQLTYLWRVHGCDYYGGTLLSDPAECAPLFHHVHSFPFFSCSLIDWSKPSVNHSF